MSVLGKTGEPRVGAKVSIELGHECLEYKLKHELQADANGQVVLGALTADIFEVTATSGRSCVRSLVVLRFRFPPKNPRGMYNNIIYYKRHRPPKNLRGL